jgi:Family of unknown function (DUF5946)
MPLVACTGCGALFPDLSGPVHDYMESSPGCWHAFGQVLEREYSDPHLAATHRLSVDSYAVQHPGGESRQAIQSVGIHLSRLCIFLERGLAPAEANDAMLRIGKYKSAMIKLSRPVSLGSVTVADVVEAHGVENHLAAVNRWARAAWQAWVEHHETIRRWADAA